MIYLVMKRNRYLAIVRSESGIAYRWRPSRAAATRFCREDAETYARIYHAEIVKS